MPGLSLHYSPKPVGADKKRQLLQAAETMLLDNRYQVSDIYSSQHLTLFFTAYAQYPRQIFEPDNFLILVEGHVYSQATDLLEQELGDLAQVLSDGGENRFEDVARWQWDADGEFIVLIIDKRNDAFSLFNDSQAFLPLFQSSDGTGFYLSRERKFVVEASQRRSIDRTALAESLAYNLNIGNRTLSEGVTQVHSCSLFYRDEKSEGVKEKILNEWNWSEWVDPGPKIGEYAQSLVDTYLSATRRRLAATGDLKTVLALSGGLDSRAALAALRSLNADFSAETCIGNEKINAVDADVARKLVEVLTCDWRLYELPPVQLSDVLRIVRSQEGSTDAVMAGGYHGYNRIRGEFGDAGVLVTGDGGYLMRRPVEPPARLQSVEDLCDDTMGRVILFDAEIVERLLRMPSGKLRQLAIESLLSYPESDLKAKYARFSFIDRPCHYVKSGMDRTRFQFWLYAPLFATDMVKLIRCVPGNYKAGYELYQEFLKRLDPASLKVAYANIGSRLGSKRAELVKLVKSFVTSRPRLYRMALRLHSRQQLKGYANPQLEELLVTEALKSELVAECFDLKVVRELLNRKMPRLHFFKLATMLLSVAQIERGPLPIRSKATDELRRA